MEFSDSASILPPVSWKSDDRNHQENSGNKKIPPHKAANVGRQAAASEGQQGTGAQNLQVSGIGRGAEKHQVRQQQPRHALVLVKHVEMG